MPHYFNLPVSLDRVKDVFSKVEHLELRNLCSLTSHQCETIASESLVIIDRIIFPALHSLTLQVDWCHALDGDSCVPVPATNNVSALEQITIIDGFQASPKLRRLERRERIGSGMGSRKESYYKGNLRRQKI